MSPRHTFDDITNEQDLDDYFEEEKRMSIASGARATGQSIWMIRAIMLENSLHLLHGLWST